MLDVCSRSRASAAIYGASFLWVVAMASGCGGGEQGAQCLEPLPRAEADECDLAHAPTFEEIYSQTLNTGTCGPGSSCHTPGDPAGGLVLTDDADRAYDMLLGGSGHGADGHDHAAHALVIPGDPECSELVQRLESDDPEFQMPRGEELAASKRCAIIQWIADGAER